MTFNARAGKIPHVASQIPAYRAAVFVSSCTHVRIRYPMVPIIAKKVISPPRLASLSERNAAATQHRKETRYGGAARPCALMDVYPIACRIEGRKLDNPAKE